jgi:hypothetical protein
VDLEIVPVRWIDEVLAQALQSLPSPRPKSNPGQTKSRTVKKSGTRKSKEDVVNTH